MIRNNFSKVFTLLIPILMLFAFSTQAFAKTSDSDFDFLSPEQVVATITLESINSDGLGDYPDAAEVFHSKEIQTLSSIRESDQSATQSAEPLSIFSLEPPINLSNRMIAGEMIFKSSDESLPFVGTVALRLGLTSSNISV